jgi:hypothetical protein
MQDSYTINYTDIITRINAALSCDLTVLIEINGEYFEINPDTIPEKIRQEAQNT